MSTRGCIRKKEMDNTVNIVAEMIVPIEAMLFKKHVIKNEDYLRAVDQAKAQCRLLAEAGYRQVKSIEEIAVKLLMIAKDTFTVLDPNDRRQINLFIPEAEIIYHWLLGDDKEVKPE